MQNSRETKMESSSQVMDSPITIAMCSDLLFIKGQDGSGTLSPGPVFSFIKALKAVNDKLKNHNPKSNEVFRVLLVADSSDSLQRSIRDQKLEELITLLPHGEEHLIRELKQHKTHLYLDTNILKAQEALKEGLAAAVVSIQKQMKEVSETQLRVAFDGDAVLFSNDSELVFKRGLADFLQHEKENAEIPMNKGPFKGFLEALERLKRKLREVDPRMCPIRTYLVTSRDAGCGGYRALKTLHSWDLEMDEAVFLGGTEKGPTLERIRPHIFFDDQRKHVNAAKNVGTLAGLVPDRANSN